MNINNFKQNSLISIVLPVHNGEKYLEDSIRSVLNQTYKNFELIIVNDMSNDSTPLILKKMAEQDSRIKIVNNQRNLKLPRSLNKGFKIAKGDYLTWTSDDNLFKENAFDEMIHYFESHKDCDFVYTKIEYIDEMGEISGTADYIDGNLEELPLSNCIGACFMYRNAFYDRRSETYKYLKDSYLHEKV